MTGLSGLEGPSGAHLCQPRTKAASGTRPGGGFGMSPGQPGTLNAQKVFPHAEVELLVVLLTATAPRRVASHGTRNTRPRERPLRPSRRSSAGLWGRSHRRAGRARGGGAAPGTNQRSGQRGKAGGSGEVGREMRPMASRDARARAGLGRRSPSAGRKGGASQSEAAVERGEPMASRAGGTPANRGASGEQKGLSKAPAPFPSTISHDATAAGSGSRAVPAAAIL